MRLRLMELNAQDLFLRLAYPLMLSDLDGLSEAQWQQLRATDEPMKPLFRLRGLAQAFDEIRPDIVMICEVGGAESLATFSSLFLFDDFDSYFVAGTSQRGIDCGYLVRRDLNLKIDVDTHQNVPATFLYPHEKHPSAMAETAARAAALDLPKPGDRRLSRDVPELRLYTGGSSVPALVLLMTHLKSGFDPDGLDPRGAARRAAELRAVLGVRETVTRRYGPAVPVILTGDLNGHAGRFDTWAEFAPVYQQTTLLDALDIAGRDLLERVTHLTFINGITHARQLDYILLPPLLHERVVTEETYVYRYCYLGEWEEMPRPTSLKERWQLPSDHYPVVCTLDMPELD